MSEADFAVVDPRLELERLVLSGLVQCTTPAEAKQRFAAVAQTLQDDQFDAGGWRACWQAVTAYFAITGMPPGRDHFEELLRAVGRLSLEVRVEASQIFAELNDEEVSEPRFRYACARLLERWKSEQLSELLLDTGAILNGSWRGDATSGGLTDAIQHVRDGISKIDLVTSDARSEGELRRETGDVWSDYQKQKRGSRMGVLTGFAELDSLTQGVQPGELWLIAAFTSEGKSQTVFNLAYHAAYVQGRNVLFGTAEATRPQVRMHLVVRHSHHPKFGLSGGISYAGLKNGSLTDREQQVLHAVLEDIKTNADYGSMYIFQMPYRATVTSVRAVLSRLSVQQKPDLLVLDYLGLMTSDAKRTSKREELDDLLVSAKQLAIDANDGGGVGLVSPWQMSRAAWKEALDSGSYTKASLSDTSQAEKSTDLVMSLLKSSTEGGLLDCQVLKFRDGQSDMRFRLRANFAACLVTSDRGREDLLN